MPVEPTEEMLASIPASKYPPLRDEVIGMAKEDWSKMLSAAPTPPQPIYDEASDLVEFENWATEECERDDVEPDFSLADNGEYENVTLNIARRAWMAGAQSRAKSVEVGDE